MNEWSVELEHIKEGSEVRERLASSTLGNHSNDQS